MQSTKKQKQAVSWVEGVMLSIYEYLDIPCELFNGNIEDAEDCSAYLGKYLQKFKELTSEEQEGKSQCSFSKLTDPRSSSEYDQQRLENWDRLFKD